MDEICIELITEQRSDGSVLIRSSALPMFCVVGDNKEEACELAICMLPEYLEANVPEYVNVRKVPSARKLFDQEGERDVPIYIIAGKRNDGLVPHSEEFR